MDKETKVKLEELLEDINDPEMEEVIANLTCVYYAPRKLQKEKTATFVMDYIYPTYLYY